MPGPMHPLAGGKIVRLTLKGQETIREFPLISRIQYLPDGKEIEIEEGETLLQAAVPLLLQ